MISRRKRCYVHPWTGEMCDEAVCENKRPSISKTGKPSPHPSVARWNRKYPNIAAWMAAHPGTPAGRLVSVPCREVIYYRTRRSRRFRYGWVFACHRSELPVAAPGFEEITVEEYYAGLGLS